MATKPLFDIAQIDESWGSAEDDTYRMILGIFVPEAQSLFAELTGLLPSNDTARIQRLAHTLRGAASNVGASRLAMCAGAVEHAPAARLAHYAADLEQALQATLASIAAGGPFPGG